MDLAPDLHNRVFSERKAAKMTQLTTKKERVDRGSITNASDQVLAHLQELIEKGKLKPGERLPAERELAKMLRVSRPTLRAGLGALTAVGVLESRHGSGTYVVDGDGTPVLDPSPLRLKAALHGFTADEMFEARLALETVSAGLAAERAKSEELVPLLEAVVGTYASVDDPQQFLVHDVRFHRGIGVASHNRIIAALTEMVVNAMYQSRKETVRRAQDLKESAEWHRKIYEAIRERKADEARNTVREHLVKARAAQMQETVS